MIAYASATSTKRNLAGLRAGGWRLLYSALRTDLYKEGFRYALDNGAWSAHVSGAPFDEQAFVDAVYQLGAGADWIVAPDVVGGGMASLEMSREWLPWLRGFGVPVLLAAQDGMRPSVALAAGFDGVAIGGSTEWKLAQLRTREWRRVVGDGWLHVLRVNSQTRMRQCAWMGADSFDGSGPSRFAKHREQLQRQLDVLTEPTPPLLRLMEDK